MVLCGPDFPRRHKKGQPLRRENKKEHLTTIFFFNTLLQVLRKSVPQIKTARCLDNSPVRPAGRGQLVIRVGGGKKNIYEMKS